MKIRSRLLEVSREQVQPGVPRSGKISLWWLSAAVVALCFYRIATFTPEPLDSASTLRPLLSGWFTAFLKLYAQPEAALAAWKSFCLVLLPIPAILAMLHFAREYGMLSLRGGFVRPLCSRTLFFGSIAICLTACRFTSLLTYQMNPDEAEFLSAAHKLFRDGNFFHAVDTGTSGPLNVYPLMLPAVFGISPDYASSRVLVLLYLLCEMYVLYRTVRLLAPDSIARIAVASAAVAFAAFHHPDLLQYSSEQTPVLIVSLALYTCASVLAGGQSHRTRLLLLGLLASAAFFSKMQAVPIVFAMGAVAVAYTHASGRSRYFWEPTAVFAAGAIPLVVLNAALCAAGGVLRDFWMTYIVSNQHYADVSSSLLRDLSGFVQFLVGTAEVRLFLFGLIAMGVGFAVQRMRAQRASQKMEFLQLCLAGAVVMTAADRLQSPDAATLRGSLALFAMVAVPLYFLFFHRTLHFGADPVRWFGLLSVISIAAALYCVYKPHRPFPHYLLFLYIPGCMALAWMLVRQAGDESPQATEGGGERYSGFRPAAPFAFVLLTVVLTVSNAAYVWATEPDRISETLAATVNAPESEFIRSLTSPEGEITVWGWTADPYLGSGRVPATRDLNVGYLFAASPGMTPYYHERFVRDLRANPPELFIDAVGPTSWVCRDRAVFNFEQFPEIAGFVTGNYVHVADGYGQRFYLRRDLAARNPKIPATRNCAPKALRCVDAPLRNPHAAGGAMLDQTAVLDKIELPAHARIEAQFTPAGVQPESATVFQNEAVPNSFRGFRFQSIGGDRYRLIVGQGDRWAFSKSLLLSPGRTAFVSIEIDGNDVYVRANGRGVDDMHLASPVADAPGPITLGSWIGGQCRFWGTIQFFEIVALS